MPPKLSEPIVTISAVLTLKQVMFLNDQAEKRGEKRTVVLREIVERGIKAEQAKAKKEQRT